MSAPSFTRCWLGRGVGLRSLSLSLLLASCSRSPEPARKAGTGPARAQIAPTANVPALLGVSIDGLRHRLGPPQPLPAALRPSEATLFVGASAGELVSLATFRTGGLTLVASYDTRSREVRDLLLLGQHEDSLMGRAALRANAVNYLIMPVFYVGSANRLLGLRVIATN